MFSSYRGANSDLALILSRFLCHIDMATISYGFSLHRFKEYGEVYSMVYQNLRYLMLKFD